MNASRPTFALRLLMTGLLLPAASLSCHASLGRAPTAFPAASTNAVRAHVLAASGAAGANAAGYTVNSSVLAGGTTVREYVGADGLVFAVSWNGPFMPDLRTLLGDQFTTMTAEAARHPKAGHSQLRVERPEVTIESTGHMRAYAGRAWLTARLPAGFKPQDIE
jgi:hypothetical protein